MRTARVLALTMCLGSWLLPAARADLYHFVRSISPHATDAAVVGVAVNPYSGHVYLGADSATNPAHRMVEAFTFSGNYVMDIGFAEAVNDVAVGPSGNIYLADGFGKSVLEYTSSGSFVRIYDNGQNPVLVEPFLSVSSDLFGNLWGADGDGHVGHWSNSGQLLGQFTVPLGQFEAVSSIAADPIGAGLVFVAIDNQALNLPGGNRVLVYDSGGTFLREFGTPGSGNGQFNDGDLGLGLAVDAFLHVYVADSGNNRVQVFDGSTGAYLTKFGVPGDGDGQLNSPRSIAVDPLGENVWVADANNRVQQFQIPEPSAALLLATGLLGLLGRRYWPHRGKQRPTDLRSRPA